MPYIPARLVFLSSHSLGTGFYGIMDKNGGVMLIKIENCIVDARTFRILFGKNSGGPIETIVNQFNLESENKAEILEIPD